MQIRLPIPYATRTKGLKQIRIGVGTINVREVAPQDAPVVARQTDNFTHSYEDDNSQVTDFRLLDGVFFVPYRRSTFNDRKYPFSTLRDIPDANRLKAHENLIGWEAALDSVPFLPGLYDYESLIGNVPLHYGQPVPDEIDDVPALLNSKSWDYVRDRVNDVILIGNAIYMKSIGPAFDVWSREDGTVKLSARSAVARVLPGPYTRMAWDRDDILAEFEGRISGDDLDRIIRVADGIDLKSLDTGYDPLPLAIEDMAWGILNEAHSMSNVPVEHMKAVLDLRKGVLECISEAETLFGSRYPVNPRKWDSILAEPGKAYGLMPLIDAYRSVHWINGIKSGQIEDLRRSLERTLSDEAALSNVFG